MVGIIPENAQSAETLKLNTVMVFLLQIGNQATRRGFHIGIEDTPTVLSADTVLSGRNSSVPIQHIYHVVKDFIQPTAMFAIKL